MKLNEEPTKNCDIYVSWNPFVNGKNEAEEIKMRPKKSKIKTDEEPRAHKTRKCDIDADWDPFVTEYDAGDIRAALK